MKFVDNSNGKDIEIIAKALLKLGYAKGQFPFYPRCLDEEMILRNMKIDIERLAHIQRIEISKEKNRNKGYGSLLLEKFEEKCRSLGASAVLGEPETDKSLDYFVNKRKYTHFTFPIFSIDDGKHKHPQYMNRFVKVL